MNKTKNSITTWKAIGLAFLGWSVIPCAVSGAFDHPGGLHTQEHLDYINDQIDLNNEPWVAGYTKLFNEAENYKNTSTHAVSTLYIPGYYEDPDGNAQAIAGIRNDARAAYCLALAYSLDASSKFDYADKAVEIMNDWASTNTTLSPNGDTPLVMANTGVGLVFAAELLYDYGGWSSGDRSAFLTWVTNKYRPNVNSIKSRDNNWACWGMMGSMAASHLIESTSGMNSNLVNLKQQIENMIAPNGSLPEETQRGDKGMWYTYFALAPMTRASQYIMNYSGENMYIYDSPSGRSLKEALDFLHNYVRDPSSWPYYTPQSNTPTTGGWPGDLYESMHAIYGTGRYGNWVAQSRAVMINANPSLAWKYATLTKPLVTGQATQTFSATEDAFVRDGTHANTNYGSNTGLTVKSDNTGYNRRVYLKFDFSSFAGDGVGRAKLKLCVKDVGTRYYRKVKIYAVPNETWDEDTITWNNAPSTGAYLLTNPDVKKNSAGVWYEWDIDEYVADNLDDGVASFVLINNDTANSQSHVIFSSKEDSSNQPYLEIQPLSKYEAADDAFVRGGNYANNNYGGADKLAVKTDGSNYVRKSYLKFDFSSLQSTNINYARIWLWVDDTGGQSSKTIKVYGVPGTGWSESTITWNNAPSTGEYIGSFDVDNSSGYWIDVNVGHYVSKHLDGGTVSFLLVNEGSPHSGSNVAFTSAEGSTNRPLLIIR